MDNKECCKWCGWCINLQNNKGKCCFDIGFYIQNTEEYCCGYYYFDNDLDRC